MDDEEKECSQESSLEKKLLEDAVLYIREKKYREDCVTKNEKRCIRRKAQRFVIDDGELFYTKKDKTKVRYVTDPSERQRILLSCHQHPTSGHMGTKKTLARVTERFMWPGVSKDVYSLVKECDICQRMTKKMETGVPELHPVPVVSTWHHIGIDFIGPLKYKSRQGNKYILTISDYFSKFTQAFACKDKEAVTVCDALFKLFMQFGIPKVVTSDQGSEFNNNMDKKLMKLLNIDHRLTSPYHPQANGLDERFNQTLQSMIVKFVEDKKEKWEDYLPTCVYAYNTSKHESSKHAPFTVMFGRQAVLPVEVSSPTKANVLQKTTDTDHDNKDNLIDEHFLFHNKRLEKVKANIVDAQARQKKAYDKKRHDPGVFKCDALVLKRDMKRKKRAGGKMDFKWVGPFKVLASMGRGLYKIQNLDCPMQTEKIHGIHLKPYFPSQETPKVKSPEVMQNSGEGSMIDKTAESHSGSVMVYSLQLDQGFVCSSNTEFENSLNFTDSTALPITEEKEGSILPIAIDEANTISMSLNELKDGPGFDHSSPKHPGGYFAEFLPVDDTGTPLSPIAVQQQKDNCPAQVFSAKRAKNLVDEVLGSPNGVIKCKRVLNFTADYKDDNQMDVKKTRKRKLIKPLRQDADLLIEPERKCRKLKTADVDHESPSIKDKFNPCGVMKNDSALKCENELKDESQLQKKQSSSQRLLKICQSKHKWLLEAKIGKYKLYDLSILSLARRNTWVSDEVITAYFHFLVNSSNMKERILVVDSTVMNKICKGKFFNDDRKLIKLNIHLYDYAIGAFLQGGNHWVLLCIDVKTFCITYVDPKGEKNVMMCQLEKYWRNYGDFQYLEGIWGKEVGKWRVNTKPHCLQRDDDSCGVFVMKFAECIVKEKPLPMAMNNLNVIRQKMAIELLDASESLQNYCRACGMCSTDEDDGAHWIRCDRCDWWFHLSCVNKSCRKNFTVEEAAKKQFCGPCCSKANIYTFK